MSPFENEGEHSKNRIYFKTAESEGDVIHPTQKPVSLGRYFVKTYSNPGDVILDNTSGSGSFVVAALLEGRNFVAIEKNKDVHLFKDEEIDYIKATRERIKEAWNSMDTSIKATVARENLIMELDKNQDDEQHSCKEERKIVGN